jgi:hypothetical protein
MRGDKNLIPDGKAPTPSSELIAGPRDALAANSHPATSRGGSTTDGRRVRILRPGVRPQPQLNLWTGDPLLAVAS